MKNPKTKILFGILAASGFILYLVFLGPRVIKESAVSPVVKCENNNASAKVVRREKRFFELGESINGRRYSWWIVVTTPEGQIFETRLGRNGSSGNIEIIMKLREVSYELSWDDSGRCLIWSRSLIWSTTAAKQGTAYFTGNSVFYGPKPVVVGEKAQPLTDEIKEKMQAHPDMMEASASISGYEVLTGDYNREDIINLREDVLLLVRPDFDRGKTLMSFGPVIVEGMADVKEVKSAKWIFLDTDNNLFRKFAAEKIYVMEPKHTALKDWQGDGTFENCKEFILISRKDLSEK